MEIPGGGGSNGKPSGTENPGVGVGAQTGKNPPWREGGGGDGNFLEPHNGTSFHLLFSKHRLLLM